jgi:hypothetical protein
VCPRSRERLARSQNLSVLVPGEAAETHAQLQRVDAGVGPGNAGVGNVHEAQFGADIIFAAKKMKSQRAAGGEVYVRSSIRNFYVSEKCAAADFKIRRNTFVRIQHPFKRKRIYAEAVGCARFLRNDKNGDDVDGIFQSSAKKSRPMRVGKNQAEAAADVGDAVAGLASVNGVSAATPHLPIVAASFGSVLRARVRGAEKECSKNDQEKFQGKSHQSESLKTFDEA